MTSGAAGGISLEAAIREKYCSGDSSEETLLPAKNQIKETTAVYMRPGAYPVQQRTSLVLERCGLSCVASAADMADLCPQLQELHLANNTLTWKDVNVLLTVLPQLTFLDLTQNHLPSPSSLSQNPLPLSPSPSSLHTLVLNNTQISWPSVQLCLTACPSLQELHLSNNGYSDVNLDPNFSHGSLQRLHVNNNDISEWVELERLGHAFPALHTLVVIANPLRDTPNIASVFPSLRSLTLNSTRLSQWSSIEALTTLLILEDLGVHSTPLGHAMEEKDRRFAIIARMPALQKLNKSEISVTERENAERWAVRYYQGKTEQPRNYQQLVETHGPLDQLAEVDLSPHHQAVIQFHIDHAHWKRCEVHTVDLHQTVGQLKHWLSRQLNFSQSKLRLFHVDPRMEEMPSTDLHCSRTRQLFALQMKDGDHIHVQIL